MTSETKYEYITIHKLDQKDDPTKVMWFVLNKKHGDTLGEIGWYGPWRQYVFEPWPNTIFSAGCLADIQDFIKKS